MIRLFGRFLVTVVLVLAATVRVAYSEGGQKFWSVTGVQADDVLHLRDLPSADSKSLAGIPANANGLEHLGCLRRQLPIDDYMNMSEIERKYARTLWCRVRFKSIEGWVAGRYLKDKNGVRPK